MVINFYRRIKIIADFNSNYIMQKKLKKEEKENKIKIKNEIKRIKKQIKKAAKHGRHKYEICYSNDEKFIEEGLCEWMSKQGFSVVSKYGIVELSW